MADTLSMTPEATYFQFTYNLAVINAAKRTAGEKEFYILQFSNEIPPVELVAVRSTDGGYEWDTVPPGNTELACSIGKLIEEYYRAHGDETEEE